MTTPSVPIKPTLAQYRILLIEDTPDDEDLMYRALKTTELDSEVLVAHDGAEALQFLLSACHAANAGDIRMLPHVIFSDVKMPKVDGLELVKQIRTYDQLRTIPIVLLSSSTQPEDIERAYLHGANSYVEKPVDALEFSQVVIQMGLYWLGVNKPILPIADTLRNRTQTPLYQNLLPSNVK